MSDNKHVKWFENLRSGDTDSVGGKNASLGEMIQDLEEKGVRVPGGFATTADAYRAFIEENDLRERLEEQIGKLRQDNASLEKIGKAVRKLFLDGEFPDDVEKAISEAYEELSSRYESEALDVAVRSSATAEDLPEASFAGQQETYLNISGKTELIDACRKCYASLFTDRAIAYREEKDFDHLKVALSVGVQKMVRADKGGAGVMFSLDTETGFPDIVVIDAAWGLGENVVQGTVNPDEYRVFKPLLEKDGCTPIVEKSLGSKAKTMVYAKGGNKPVKNVDTRRKQRERFVLEDDEILQLARWACVIENHYEKPMDMEWAKDGDDGKLYIVQARPETVQSQKAGGSMRTYRLDEEGKVLAEGLAIGDAIASGKAIVLEDAEQQGQFEDGAVLVTEMTDPDWGPILKRASAVVTEHGGRTSHAAIVSRELGIPAVVGAEDAMNALSDADEVTVSCAGGETGTVYEGELEFTSEEVDLSDIPESDLPIMMNIATPNSAFRWWKLPAEGVGLARMEFIVNNVIRVHPMALIDLDKVEDKDERKEIERLTRGFEDRGDYFVEHLSRGIAKIAAAQHPHPVVVRLSDFKTNEYANLLGGAAFEPEEENPMLGFRGASRYYSDRYRPGFELECRALRRARNEFGFTNIVVMVPFCRTVKEADKVLEVMADNGLARGEDALEVYMMCEIPSNVVAADEFAERFDGFSIGSNDLTQLVLGVDRDSEELSDVFDEQDVAVKRTIRSAIEAAHRKGIKVGICGQAPSDYPEFAEFLVEAGIDSISLNPDSVLEVKRRLGNSKK
ncbi:MAG: phosphoenolpyruvate synthase [Verrucomicrobiota bacterium]